MANYKRKGDKIICCDEHKFVFSRNDSYWREDGRYSAVYTSIDYFYCEKCLETKSIQKKLNINNHEIPEKLPDWARGITKKVV